MAPANTEVEAVKARETFMKLPVLAWYITNKANLAESLESETTRIWLTIIHHYFRVENGFTTTAEHFLDLNPKLTNQKGKK
ncbi:hypothetical protein F5Y18DRAFT_431400 [Xylariaceae sp. FL1019]|nr:hypothetical protein F5Y18DRAFT_431400 [Xylariaceae sp. FL1019]